MADRVESENPQGPASTGTADPTHVFISYASPDAAVALALVEALESQGVSCWIAPRDVDAGALYADAIVRAISAARGFVLVLSANSIASSHVGKEIERASSRQRPIFALRIDAAPLTPALEYFLSESQWIEAQAGVMEPAYAKLIGAIRKSPLAAPGVFPSVTQSRLALPAVHATRRRNRTLLAAGIAAVAAALVALLVHRSWLGTNVAAGQPAGPVTNVISDKSIAVLPFTDMSEKKDQEYFGDGMAEEILDLLAKIPGLTVIGRTSSFQFKGKNEDLRAIGAKLHAAYVLEGSVRKAGDLVRITAQLINTRSGAHEWSETYNRPVGDVLKLQDAIAGAVVRELQLTVADRYLISRSTVKNTDAYDLVLRGRHAADRFNMEGYEEAATLFQEALDRDPTFASAAAELAWTYEEEGEAGFLAPIAAFEQARHAATTALELDPKSAEAHAVLGRIHIAYDWDWAGAQHEFQQAAILAPGSEDVLSGEAQLSMALGRCDDALRQITAAIAHDPLDANNFFYLSVIQGCHGHLPEAETAMRRVLEVRPTYAWAHYYLALVLLARGDSGGALVEMQQETTDVGKRQGLAMAYHAVGNTAQSDAMIAWMIKEHADDNAWGIAVGYAFRGQAGDAMQWLERAYVQKESSLFYVKAYLPLKPIRADPRYKAFLKKMNLPE